MRVSTLVVAAALLLHGANAVAQTVNEKLPRLRRAGEKSSEVTMSGNTADDVQIEIARRRALGERADVEEVTGLQAGPVSYRRLNARVGNRQSNRIPTRNEGSQAGDSIVSDGTRGNAERPRR